MQLISKFFIITGLFCIAIGMFLLWERNNPKKLSFENFTSTNYTNYNVYPVRIRIPSLNVDLPIVQSTIENNQWSTSKDGISYLSTSPLPGKKGIACYMDTIGIIC